MCFAPLQISATRVQDRHMTGLWNKRMNTQGGRDKPSAGFEKHQRFVQDPLKKPWTFPLRYAFMQYSQLGSLPFHMAEQLLHSWRMLLGCGLLHKFKIFKKACRLLIFYWGWQLWYPLLFVSHYSLQEQGDVVVCCEQPKASPVVHLLSDNCMNSTLSSPLKRSKKLRRQRKGGARAVIDRIVITL
jgi:hypothetical protein